MFFRRVWQNVVRPSTGEVLPQLACFHLDFSLKRSWRTIGTTTFARATAFSVFLPCLAEQFFRLGELLRRERLAYRHNLARLQESDLATQIPHLAGCGKHGLFVDLGGLKCLGLTFHGLGNLVPDSSELFLNLGKCLGQIGGLLLREPDLGGCARLPQQRDKKTEAATLGHLWTPESGAIATAFGTIAVRPSAIATRTGAPAQEGRSFGGRLGIWRDSGFRNLGFDSWGGIGGRRRRNGGVLRKRGKDGGEGCEKDRSGFHGNAFLVG